MQASAFAETVFPASHTEQRWLPAITTQRIQHKHKQQVHNAYRFQRRSDQRRMAGRVRCQRCCKCPPAHEPCAVSNQQTAESETDRARIAGAAPNNLVTSAACQALAKASSRRVGGVGAENKHSRLAPTAAQERHHGKQADCSALMKLPAGQFEHVLPSPVHCVDGQGQQPVVLLAAMRSAHTHDNIEPVLRVPCGHGEQNCDPATEYVPCNTELSNNVNDKGANRLANGAAVQPRGSSGTRHTNRGARAAGEAYRQTRSWANESRRENLMGRGRTVCLRCWPFCPWCTAGK